MKKTSHAASIEQSFIRRLLETMLALFGILKIQKEAIEKLKQELQSLIENNPDFEDILADQRENIKQYMLIAAVCFCFIVDFMLLFNAITILTKGGSIGSIFKLLLPALLVILEITVSYFSILRLRSGNRGSWVSRHLQYLVILLIVALSALVIVFSLLGYTPGIDGNSRFGFFIGSVLVQVLLLVPAIMMHLWLILFAEHVAEAIAYFRFRLARMRLAAKINRLEKKCKEKLWPKLVKLTHQFAMHFDRFKQAHPEADGGGFERSTPADLSKLINTIMGYSLLPAPTFSNAQHLEP